ncbi:MAG: aminoacyl-tRNA hydrolase [Clostridia bacterium]|nr:aminoacyl-tRNA hydrolase [Clostridia bacterium]
MNIFDLFKSIESSSSDRGSVEWLIVGLGNVGSAYEKTRHNAGFLAIDRIAQALGVRTDRAKFHALTCEATIASHRVLLMKPTTLMNNSGVAVGEAAAFYKIPPEHILVLHDEISFPPGKLRLRRKGSAGGHNGLKSIIEHIGSDAFPRVKIGVGNKPRPDYDLADWVLSRFGTADLEAMEPVLKAAPEIAELIVSDRMEEAMGKYFA